MRNTTKEITDIERLQILDQQLQRFYSPKSCVASELLGVVGEAFLCYMADESTQHSFNAKSNGFILRQHISQLSKLLKLLDVLYYPEEIRTLEY